MPRQLNISSNIKDYTVNFITSIYDIVQYIDNKDIITVIDSNINKLYPQLQNEKNIVLYCDQNLKTLEGVNSIIKIFLDLKINTSKTLLVIGGGVLQDIIGFCASIYCRGIKYILVPTTLLAQVDSCIGGKTSINFQNRKNILGTFYPPTNIIIYTQFINTLTKQDLYSGLGEIYKFYILQDKIDEFNIDIINDQIIYQCLEYKANILKLDEFDKGQRKFLNYGHTFGHALQIISQYKIPHGIAVIVGVIIAVMIANKLQFINESHDVIIQTGFSLIKESNIIYKKQWFDLSNLLQIIKSDKKSIGKLTMVFVDNNKPLLYDVTSLNILQDVINQIWLGVK